jgi:hypothetical protein
MRNKLLAATAAAVLIAAAGAAQSQTATDTQGGDRKATSQQTQGPDPKKAQTNQGRSGAPVADKKTGTDGANRTTSTDGTQGPKELSTEQRTKISSSMRSHKNLYRVDRAKVNFDINVGTVVPRSLNLALLPAPIISAVPFYRGYLYMVVGDQLLIVHPRTHEIVAVLPA